MSPRGSCRVGRGLAVAHFNNDGRLDVAISSVGRRAVLLAGRAPERNWLEIRARGTASSSFGPGATVRVRVQGNTQVREITNVASYLSSSDTRLHVGLGTATRVDELEILWPSGRRQMLPTSPSITSSRSLSPADGDIATLQRFAV